jgi:DNA repair protein RadB
MKYTTGVKELDDLLSGGYESRIVTQFYGPTKSGKTTLAAYTPIGQVYKYYKESKGGIPSNHKFFVVDGDGGFDHDRAEQVWRGMQLTEEDIEEIRKNLLYWQPTSFGEQHTIIMKEIPSIIEPSTSKDKKKQTAQPIYPLLLVADPLIAEYRGHVLTTPRRFKMVVVGESTGKLDREIIKLRQLAVKYGCPAIITSWPGSDVGKMMKTEDGKPPPAAEQNMIGGRAFGFIPKTIIELQILVKGLPLRRAVIEKHRAKPEGLSCQFRLTDRGVESFEASGS